MHFEMLLLLGQRKFDFSDYDKRKMPTNAKLCRCHSVNGQTKNCPSKFGQQCAWLSVCAFSHWLQVEFPAHARGAPPAQHPLPAAQLPSCVEFVKNLFAFIYRLFWVQFRFCSVRDICSNILIPVQHFTWAECGCFNKACLQLQTRRKLTSCQIAQPLFAMWLQQYCVEPHWVPKVCTACHRHSGHEAEN